MPGHIVVVFDHSGSMSRGFSGSSAEPGFRGEYASQSTKIEEAKTQLTSWLKTSSYHQVTIIPFSSEASPSETFVLPQELHRVQAFLEEIEASGGTNLASALRLALAVEREADAFLRYLIVTDGLSQTREADLALVAELPRDEGIDAILIDPTPEGERHARRLCVRGRYSPVYGAPGLRVALEERGAEYQSRADLHGRLSMSMRSVGILRERLTSLSHFASKLGEDGTRVRSMAEELNTALGFAAEDVDIMRERIANADYPIAALQEQLSKVETLCRTAEDFVVRVSRGATFRVSLARPRRLAKGYASFFLVQLFLREARHETRKVIAELLRGSEVVETVDKSTVIQGRTIIMHLSSTEVDFSDSVKKILDRDAVHALFLGKPKESCRPGNHLGLLTIRDAADGHEYDSIPFRVEIVDYAFDHISRPFLGRLTATVAAIVSFASFLLAFLEKVDKGFGLASGTAGGFIALLLLGRIANIYRNPIVTSGSNT